VDVHMLFFFLENVYSCVKYCKVIVKMYTFLCIVLYNFVYCVFLF
jgi:hypothetical protein